MHRYLQILSCFSFSYFADYFIEQNRHFDLWNQKSLSKENRLNCKILIKTIMSFLSSFTVNVFNELVSVIGHSPGNTSRGQEYSHCHAIRQSVWGDKKAMLGVNSLGVVSVGDCSSFPE